MIWVWLQSLELSQHLGWDVLQFHFGLVLFGYKLNPVVWPKTQLVVVLLPLAQLFGVGKLGYGEGE